jgi:hypothetical protein
MWPSLIVVHDTGLEETVELFLMQDQEMIQAFSSHASQKAFADGICSWRSVRRSKYLDATRCCDASETVAKLAIIIANEIPGSLSIGSCFSQLLRCPSVGRRARYADMNDLTRAQFDDEESKK